MYSRILVVVGREQSSRAAIREAVALAQVHAASVIFFMDALWQAAVPLGAAPDRGTLEEALSAGEFNGDNCMPGVRAIAERAGVGCVCVAARAAIDADGIIRVARQHCCDLIVVGSAGKTAMERLLNGSIIPGLITRSRVPVLVCCQQRSRGWALRGGAVPAIPRQEQLADSPEGVQAA